VKDIMIASSKTPAPSFVFKEFGHVITDSSAMPKSSNENDLDGGTNRLPTKGQSCVLVIGLWCKILGGHIWL
jgi:hypothetical protein